MNELIIAWIVCAIMTVSGLIYGVIESKQSAEKRRLAKVRFWQISQEIEEERKRV